MAEEKIDLKSAFASFKDEKHIDRPVMMGVLKDVFITQIAKTYGSADNFDVIINVDKGDCEIYQNLDVVEEVENPNTEISLDELKEMGEDDYEIGETFTRKVELKDFGRRGILNIRQNLQGRIMDIEKANLYNKTQRRWASSSRARFTRPGRRKRSSSTRTGTSSGCPSRSRYRASTSRRTIPSAP